MIQLLEKHFYVQAAIYKDSRGSIIKCVSFISSSCSPIYGKALATQLAISMGLSNFILEGNSLIVTLGLQLPTITQDWRIASTISVIHSILSPTTSWITSKVNRSANFYAHHVTNWAATIIYSGCILILFPSSSYFSLRIGKNSPSSFYVP
jgi:hypothetical protein